MYIQRKLNHIQRNNEIAIETGEKKRLQNFKNFCTKNRKEIEFIIIYNTKLEKNMAMILFGLL